MKIGFLAALPYLLMAALPPAFFFVNAASAANLLLPEIHAGLNDGHGSGFFSLTWNEPVSTRSEWKNRDLSLYFTRPLADAPVADLGSQLAGAVETIRYGYDSVLLRLAPGF